MPSIGAAGIVGVAIEVTANTYLAPTLFVPVNKESIKFDANMQERVAIRNTPGLIGLVPGNGSVSGDLEFDVSADILAVFLYASRCGIVKTGTGPYVYTATPAATAIPVKTLSISIKRGNEVFGYVGCAISSMKFSISDSGILQATMSVVGVNETTQAALVATWPTTPVISAGMYSLQIPTATQIFDCDKFEFSTEDNAQVNARIKNTAGAQFVNFGESRAKVTVERDFETRAQYDIYKAGTSQSVSLVATQAVGNIVSLVMPSAITNTYELNLGGQGDLLRAKVEYSGVIDGTGKHYQIIVTSTVNII